MSAVLWAVGVGLGVQVIVLATNLMYWFRRNIPEGAPVAISVLIPARNEVHNLPRLLSLLAGQSHAPFEVLVCDDASDDGTTEWLAQHATGYGAEWFAGSERPPAGRARTGPARSLGHGRRGIGCCFWTPMFARALSS